MLTINERVKALEDRQRRIEEALKSAAGHIMSSTKPQQPGETTEQFTERIRTALRSGMGQIAGMLKRQP